MGETPDVSWVRGGLGQLFGVMKPEKSSDPLAGLCVRQHRAGERGGEPARAHELLGPSGRTDA